VNRCAGESRGRADVEVALACAGEDVTIQVFMDAPGDSP
jgi:hypothetical protein